MHTDRTDHARPRHCLHCLAQAKNPDTGKTYVETFRDTKPNTAKPPHPSFNQAPPEEVSAGIVTTVAAMHAKWWNDEALLSKAWLSGPHQAIAALPTRPLCECDGGFLWSISGFRSHC